MKLDKFFEVALAITILYGFVFLMCLPAPLIFETCPEYHANPKRYDFMFPIRPVMCWLNEGVKE